MKWTNIHRLIRHFPAPSLLLIKGVIQSLPISVQDETDYLTVNACNPIRLGRHTESVHKIMVSLARSVVVAMALPQLAVAGEYLSDLEVEKLFSGKTYFEDASQDFTFKTYKEFQFRDDGTVNYRIYWTDGLWQTDFPWRVKKDGRLCIPNNRGKEKCRFVQVDGRKILLFNKKGELKATFTP